MTLSSLSIPRLAAQELGLAGQPAAEGPSRRYIGPAWAATRRGEANGDSRGYSQHGADGVVERSARGGGDRTAGSFVGQFPRCGCALLLCTKPRGAGSV